MILNTPTPPTPPTPEPSQLSRTPTTTNEQDLLTASQRRVNLIWEMTQAMIAVAVTGSTLFVAGSLAVRGTQDTAPFLLLSNAFFLVIGFYFGRTNHARAGDTATGSMNR